MTARILSATDRRMRIGLGERYADESGPGAKLLHRGFFLYGRNAGRNAPPAENKLVQTPIGRRESGWADRVAGLIGWEGERIERRSLSCFAVVRGDEAGQASQAIGTC